METEVLIHTPFFIEVQGDDALELINYSCEQVKYRVRGFAKPQLFLSDFRREINKVLEQRLREDDLCHFANIFCQPAEAILERTADGDLHLQLYDTLVRIPNLMCWIVVGFEGEFPEYPSLILEVQAITTKQSAGLCIYPLEQDQMAAFIGLSANVSFDSSVQLE